MQHRVLFVDDDREMLEVFSHMLRREPYAIDVASTALGALEILGARPVSVIVADQSMPGISGTELLARVQAEYPEVMRVMVTGHASVEVAMRAINEGNVFRFLTKPVRTVDLLSTLRDAVGSRQARSSAAADPTTRQRSEIAQLENEWRGLTHVERDASGAIVVDESADELADLLREMKSRPDDSLSGRSTADRPRRGL
jgi:DNA-binding NtrC family response regulator